MQTEQLWDFTEREKELVTSFIGKGKAEQSKNERFAIIDLDSYYKLFTNDEIAIMKKWLAIRPESLGYKLPFLGVRGTPRDIVSIANQTYTFEGESYTIPCQYLPREVYEAYGQLNEKMHSDIGKGLFVLFGHRSPARQIFIFFDILVRFNFDFNKTVQRVCFPDYSEHVCIQRQAIDFMVHDGPPSDEFDKTDQYIWLQKNAKQFGFYESYPKDNELGMTYEPWHWHYEGPV